MLYTGIERIVDCFPTHFERHINNIVLYVRYGLLGPQQHSDILMTVNVDGGTNNEKTTGFT